MDTGDGMCPHEHGVLSETDESQDCTPETNSISYVN